LQPVEKTHTKQIIPELAWLRHKRRDRSFGQASDGNAIECHRGRSCPPIGSIDIDRVIQNFDRQTSGLGGFLRQNDRAGPSIEYHWNSRSIDMCGDCKIAPMTTDDFDVRAVTGYVTRDKLGHDAVGDLPELEAVAVTDDNEQPDDGPEQGCLDGLRKPLAEQRQDQAAEENQQYDFQGKRADVVPQQISDGILIAACDQGCQRNSYAKK